MDLRAAKLAAGNTVSVCLPARDEEATIGAIVEEIRARLGGPDGLVDEIVVVDDGSLDGTGAVARAAGARVVAEREILPEAGPGSGKGNALWKSLHECTGDLVCWIDADLRNFEADFVTRLLEPLLTQPDICFVKAYYHRSYEGSPTGGGRVTELVARPVLSLLFPKLADIVQPLGGEYAGRLLIDIIDRFGRDAVAQVDLGVREHRNRPLAELGPQALAILATGLRRAGLIETNAPYVELLRGAADGTVDAVPVEVRERPPIATVPGYRAAH